MSQEIVEKIIPQSMEEVMHSSMMPFAEYVILERALPRVEDGLKPVQRRILYTMHQLGLTPDMPHRKSARIVGDTLGKYHPHGDTSVYDALVRMAQPFSIRMPLIDGQGNFGSVDGDPAAALRYTEARMTPLAIELLRDVEKNTVPFRLNFDDSDWEPDMLPGRFPNLLVNGATGIAVGLATNIPPHNLGETIDAAIALMNDPQISLSKLMEYVKGPDFPTGGYLLGAEDLHKAYETGRGRVIIRAKAHIEPQKNGKKLIVVTEFPYMVNKAAALEKILKLGEEKKQLFAGISDIRDESDREGMRAVIEIKKDADAEKILTYLYKYSDLQVSFSLNMVAIADSKPRQMGLKEMLERYIQHQKNVVTRRTQFDLDKAEKRAHILEGLMIALDHLDEVIALIRASKTPAEAKAGLVAKFGLTPEQAQAILDLRLQRLTGLEMNALREEYANLLKLLEELRSILASEKKLLKVIGRELLEIKKKHADARRTEILYESHEIQVDESELTVVEDAIICVSDAAIRRLPVRVSKANQEEPPDGMLFETKTNRRIQLFTNFGVMYTLTVSDIPESKPKDRGTTLAGLFAGWQDGERVLSMFELDGADENTELVFYTKSGMIKRTTVPEFVTRNRRFAAYPAPEGELIGVCALKRDENVLLVTKLGMSIRFSPSDVPVQGRGARGVKAIALMNGDAVLTAAQTPDEGEVFVLSDRGYGKRSLIFDYEIQGRGGKGLKTFDFKKNGSNGYEIVSAFHVTVPKDIVISQKHGDETRLNTDEVLIEARNSKASPVVMVMLDNVVVNVKVL